MKESQDENVYHRILELPREVTQPNHYQLLGLKRFESDPKKIKTAAMDRNALLQRMQNAENYEAVRRLEREVGEAMVCLTNPKSKAEYDESLRDAVAIMAAPVKAPAPPVQDTQPLKNANVPTVEVKVIPPPPPSAEAEKKPASSVPKSSIRMLPPPRGGQKKTPDAEQQEPKDSEKFLPGEVPWQLKQYWWQTNPELAKAIGIGAGALILVLVLVISFWPSSSAEEAIAQQKDEQPETPNSTQEVAPISKVIGPGNVNLLSSQVLFQNDSGTLNDFAMAPDGGWIAALDDKGVIHLWEESTASARVLNSSPGMEGGTATHIAATPDGGHLFAATMTGQLEDWPIGNSAQDAGPLVPQTHDVSGALASGVYSLEVTADGQQVVGTTANSELFVFDRGTSFGAIRPLDFQTSKPISILPASANASLMAVRFLDHSLQLWDPSPSNGPLQIVVSAMQGKPHLAATMNADGTRMATVNADHQIRMIDLPDGQVQPIRYQGHTGRVYAMSFNRDESLLASVGEDRSLRLWDTTNGSELAALGGHARPIVAVQFTADGESLFTASQDGIVRKWTAQDTASEPVPILPEATIAGSTNPNPLAESVSARLSISHRFQLTNPQLQPLNPGQPLVWAAISPDGRLVARSTPWGKVFIQDTKSPRPKHVLPMNVDQTGPVEFAGDGQTLIAQQSDGGLSTWDVATGRLLDQINYGSALSFGHQNMAVSAVGPRFALCNESGVEVRTRFEDLAETGKNVNLTQAAEQMALSPDGRFLATSSRTVVETWDLGDPAQNVSLGSPKSFAFQDYSAQRAFAFSPDGTLFAVGTEIGKIHVFSLETGKELASFTGHASGPLRGLAFDSQGSLLFSAGYENGVRVWSTSSWTLAAWLSPNGEAMNTGFGAATDPPIEMRLTADGKQLIVVHQSGLGVAWEVGQQNNPAIAADFTPADLTISGSTQSVTFKNFSALAKWTESAADPHALTHLDYTPDGKYLLTAGTDGVVRVWNAQTGSVHRQIALPIQLGGGLGGTQLPGAVPNFGVVPGQFGAPIGGAENLGGLRHWAISADNLLATSTDGRVIQLWDIAKGASRGTIANPKEDHIWFGFSPDGKSFLTLVATGFLKSWNVADFALVSSLPIRAGTAYASAPPGSDVLFAVGEADGAVWVVKPDGTRAPLLRNGVSPPIGQLQFSNQGRFLAAADTGGSVRLWDVASRTEIARSDLYGQTTSDMAFTPDGKALLTLSQTGMLGTLIVDPTNHSQAPGGPAPLGIGGLPGNGLNPNDPQNVNSRSKQTEGTLLALSPDGKVLAIAGGLAYSSGGQGNLAFWGVGDKPSSLTAQTQSVTQVPIASPDGITQANLAQIALLASVQGHKSVQSVVFTSDGGAFFSGGSEMAASLWDPSANPPAKLLSLSGHAFPILAVAASKTQLATGDAKGYIKLWDRHTGAELQNASKKVQHSGGVQGLAFSPNELYLGSTGQDKLVKVWNPATMTEAAQLQQEHKSTVTGLTWVDDTTILSCDAGNRVLHWSDLLLFNGGLAQPGFQPLFQPVAPKANVKIITAFGARVNGIASAPGNKAAFASDNELVGLWNGRDEDPHRLKGHTKPVRCVAFMPDGSVLASAGGDHTIRFWSTDGAGSLLHTLQIPAEVGAASYQIQAMDFSPDGRWLLTGDAGGFLKLWGLPSDSEN